MLAIMLGWYWLGSDRHLWQFTLHVVEVPLPSAVGRHQFAGSADGLRHGRVADSPGQLAQFT